ncbi:hypothetical protein [Ramlibacter humi]|uniref:Uncharacterized protein n=1 Tax=Ramlibacter humi TaxID=2530451 RepID=A0A4Z0CB35_9BURK|nr:hypothetical protein [Ramlibacter humi]TFZ08877.1 hypothetical protein EZ216_06975 [Ramlibacter humi]
MEQQDSGNPETPVANEAPADAGHAVPATPMEDSTWGVGAAAAMDNLRRHHFGARHQPQDERPASE